jgi:glutamate N-acetyltransferase/amino-acid N-acetyltransferase
MANGLAGTVDEKKFSETLNRACIEMTKMLARDGEGATKLLLANITGAGSEEEAKIIAKVIVNSPLVKTMAYGADPNIGRILMAIGKCMDCEIIPEKIELKINDKLVYQNHDRVDFNEIEVRKLLGGDRVEIKANLNVGSGGAIAYGCDLTEGYIEENTAYYSS